MLKCQKDSYLKMFEATVVSCRILKDEEKKTIFSPSDLKRLKTVVVHEVLLDDTILFPEGGGQPDDRGTIEEANVERVIRRGNSAIHFVSNGQNLEAQLKVNVTLNWERRFDNMQQHSGQHLITALMTKLFGRATLSWWLGSTESYIELDGDLLTDTDLKVCEARANELIREAAPLTVAWVKKDDPILDQARSRGLPDDVGNEIRVVTMGDLESNVCCGTHVKHLGQLQVVKLLSSSMLKGKNVVHFIVGDRAMKKLDNLLDVETKLYNIFRVRGDELPASALKHSRDMKALRKMVNSFSRDLIKHEALKFTNGFKGLVYHYNRDEGDFDFGHALLREIGPNPAVAILITMKGEGTTGHVLLRGSKNFLEGEAFEAAIEILSRVLDGKGCVRAGVYQAKVGKFQKMGAAVKELHEKFKY